MSTQAVNRMANMQRVMRGSGGSKTAVEIILGLDGTASMDPLMEGTKAHALQFHKLVREGLKAKNRLADTIRLKVLVFRDVYDKKAPAFEESDWFTLREDGQGDEELFHSFVSGIRAEGGGDDPESGLEALHRAFTTDFNKPMQGQKARRIIVLMTDQGAHALDDPRRKGNQSYPAGVPESMQELFSQWIAFKERDGRSGRLILMAPQAFPWNEVGSWQDVEYIASKAGEGVSDDAIESVIAAISGSIT